MGRSLRRAPAGTVTWGSVRGSKGRAQAHLQMVALVLQNPRLPAAGAQAERLAVDRQAVALHRRVPLHKRLR